MNKKVLVGVIAVVVVALAGWWFFGKEKENSKKATSIHVAVNMPMTGDLSIYGESVRDGINLAMDELKDSLDLYDIAISYDMQDNAGSAKNTVSIFKSQSIKGYDVYVSGITNQTLSILEDIKKVKKPHFIWSFYPLILKENENIFRTWVDYPKEAEYWKKYLKTQKPEAKRIACLYLDVVSIQELYNTLFIPSIKGDYEVVFSESFDIGTKDFKNLVAKLKQTRPDVIFINGWENHLTQIVREAINQGLKQDGNMVFTFDLLDAVKHLTEEQLNGLIANIPLYEIESAELKTDWKARFKTKYNKEANYTNAYAYDYATIMFEIAKKYAQSGDSEFDINRYIGNIDQTGITGNLSFSKSGDLIGVYKTCKYENGQFVPLDEEIINK
jgi:branched-chain amino acid transport system substrate-binding protein